MKVKVWNEATQAVEYYENPGDQSGETSKGSQPNSAGLAGGTKNDQGKAPLSLIPRSALEPEARVFAFGAKKYSRWNYTKGFEYSRLLDATMRHLVAFNDGEDLDPESQESHLAHARCSIAMLLECIALGTAIDDRRVKPVR